MARINRSDVIQKAVNDLAISTSTEKIPNETLDKVQLTYDLNKSFSTFCVSGNITTNSNLSVSLPSVSAGARIFITGAHFSIIKDVTCDVATGKINFNITPAESGIVTTLYGYSVLTLTAQSTDIFFTFPYPIEVKPGSILQSVTSYTAGLMSRSCALIGFTTSSN